jgi:threonine dehydrogenase-like Zn-dependent dehydrogenase
MRRGLVRGTRVEALVVRRGTAHGVAFVADHPDPSPPPGEVTVRVDLAGICATDLEIARGYMSFQGVPGHEFVGTVIAGPCELVGRRVVAEINCACGACDMCGRGWPGHCRRRSVLGIAGRDGAFAEMTVVPERNCHIVPAEISNEQAVFVEPLAAAVQVLELQPIDSSQRVAVLGSGRLGLLAAQVLTLQGCQLEVIGRNPHTLAFCRQRGIPAIELPDLKPQAEHDVVVECTGAPDGLRLAFQMCRPRGTIVLKSTYAGAPTLDMTPIVVNELRIVGSRCGPFRRALELLRGGRIAVEEMISATYPLRRGVEAFAAAAEPQNIKVLLHPGAA